MILCAPGPLDTQYHSSNALQYPSLCFNNYHKLSNPTFVSFEIWRGNFVRTLFPSTWPTITFSTPPGVCSHRSFSVRASCVERELLKWATPWAIQLGFPATLHKILCYSIDIDSYCLVEEFRTFMLYLKKPHLLALGDKYQLQKRKCNQYTGS